MQKFDTKTFGSYPDITGLLGAGAVPLFNHWTWEVGAGTSPMTCLRRWGRSRLRRPMCSHPVVRRTAVTGKTRNRLQHYYQFPGLNHQTVSG